MNTVAKGVGDEAAIVQMWPPVSEGFDGLAYLWEKLFMSFVL